MDQASKGDEAQKYEKKGETRKISDAVYDGKIAILTPLINSNGIVDPLDIENLEK